MNDKDKWSAHLEYLKVAITLSTAILAVAAAIYSDATKIPNDASKWALLASVIFVLLTLVTSISGVIYLSNFLIRTVDATLDTGRARKITKSAGASFFCFLATGFCILLFFLMRSFGGGVSLPASAVDSVSALLRKQISDPADRLNFVRFEMKGSKYIVDYMINQGPTSFRASVDVTTGQVELIERKP
ncbi:hypothetical protein [Bradyrhizobium aeschynomenes]|uniref:hypothetical protein n=1 Tax=Bradyrhizobium aeschynomenes TaxID=2734909 RepID=UPI001551A37F|nr:hypothetical protein [Bradyrhizobium aeschynomenes]NPV19946.1 hypothetical protein [Bradyrhizobium aeschynomenes]